jgi:spore germination protein KA
MFLTAGATGGLYAILLLLMCLSCALFAMRSVGSPLTAPLAPRRRANPDIFVRLPMKYQKARAFFAKGSDGD